MKQIALCITLFFIVMLTAGTSFGQEVDSGESQMDDTNGQEVDSEESQMAVTNDQGDVQAEPQIAKSPGLILQLGLGYGTIAAFDASLLMGVKIIPMFGLYANAVFKLGDENPNYGYEFTIVPKIHFINHGVVQLSVGLGLGYEYYQRKVHPKLTLDPLITQPPVDTYSTKAFVFKPELDVDFFVTDVLYLGFGLDVPVYVGQEHRDKPRTYALHLSNGAYLIKSRNEEEDELAKGVRFDFLFHLGCRFPL